VQNDDSLLSAGRHLRERARSAGLLTLDEALQGPHTGLRACVEHVEPVTAKGTA
jgi:hypothetical protein